MDWISSSMGRAAGVLENAGAAGVCTGIDTGGTGEMDEPQRLQKTESAGTLLPHFGQKTVGPGTGVSGCRATGAGGTGAAGPAVTTLRTGLKSSIPVPARRL